MVSNYTSQDTPHLLHRHKQQVVARAELSLLCDRTHHQTQSYVPSSPAPWNTSHHIHGQASHNTRNTPLLTTLRPSPGARSRLKCFVHPPPSVQQQKVDYKKSLCPAVGHCLAWGRGLGLVRNTTTTTTTVDNIPICRQFPML